MSEQTWVMLVVGVLGFAGVIISVLVIGVVAVKAQRLQAQTLAVQGDALVQRTDADNRGEALKRITWCLKRMFSTNDEEAGLAGDVLGEVAESPFITSSDRGELRVIAKRLTGAVAEETRTSNAYGDREEVQA